MGASSSKVLGVLAIGVLICAHAQTILVIGGAIWAGNWIIGQLAR